MSWLDESAHIPMVGKTLGHRRPSCPCMYNWCMYPVGTLSLSGRLFLQGDTLSAVGNGFGFRYISGSIHLSQGMLPKQGRIGQDMSFSYISSIPDYICTSHTDHPARWTPRHAYTLGHLDYKCCRPGSTDPALGERDENRAHSTGLVNVSRRRRSTLLSYNLESRLSHLDTLHSQLDNLKFTKNRIMFFLSFIMIRKKSVSIITSWHSNHL